MYFLDERFDVEVPGVNLYVLRFDENGLIGERSPVAQKKKHYERTRLSITQQEQAQKEIVYKALCQIAATRDYGVRTNEVTKLADIGRYEVVRRRLGWLVDEERVVRMEVDDRHGTKTYYPANAYHNAIQPWDHINSNSHDLKTLRAITQFYRDHGRGIKAKELADLLGLAHSSACHRITRLHKHCYIKRQAGKAPHKWVIDECAD